MIASKAGEGSSAPVELASAECCMCGDYGLSSELFRCKVCQFRSQHRYCSNQYPKADESYGVCNWCLIITDQKDESSVGDQKTQNSSNSSSSCRNSSAADHQINDHPTIKTKKKNYNNQHGGGLLLKDRRKLNLKIQLSSSPMIKKHKLQLVPDQQSPSLAARKRIMTSGSSSGGGGGMMEESVIRNKSKVEERSNGGGGGITKQVFRNKVRRYKLLDEVSSQ